MALPNGGAEKKRELDAKSRVVISKFKLYEKKYLFKLHARTFDREFPASLQR